MRIAGVTALVLLSGWWLVAWGVSLRVGPVINWLPDNPFPIATLWTAVRFGPEFPASMKGAIYLSTLSVVIVGQAQPRVLREWE